MNQKDTKYLTKNETIDLFHWHNKYFTIPVTYGYEGLHKRNFFVQSNGDRSRHRLDTYARNDLLARMTSD